ncbi:MAG TPA: hypothetical protein VJ183_20190 [Chloroflexia bacterium]|nr:hypothetical protein [Chloroflexia bacterium]
MNNSNTQLTVRTDFSGEPGLTFDFPSLLVGVAEYEEGPTGCTVFYFPTLAQAAVDVRGGSHGTLLTDERQAVDAVCFAGGSLLGLSAATGVSEELFALRGHNANWNGIPLVSGGIIFDYGSRENAIYPDQALGRAALRAALRSTSPGIFPLGRRGAGASATVGKGLGFDWREWGGQGGAFRQIGPTRLAVFTVVNSVGAIIDRQGMAVRGHLDPETGRRYRHMEGLAQRIDADAGTNPATRPEVPQQGNTTLTIVVTNQKLSTERGTDWSLRQFARQVHGSMSRAIEPFNTPRDGDVLWAVTTNEVDNPSLPDLALAVVASELAWDAVLNCFG